MILNQTGTFIKCCFFKIPMYCCCIRCLKPLLPYMCHCMYKFNVLQHKLYLTILAFCIQVAFYVTSHTGVMFDFKENKQRLLQGHVSSSVLTNATQSDIGINFDNSCSVMPLRVLVRVKIDVGLQQQTMVKIVWS